MEEESIALQSNVIGIREEIKKAFVGKEETLDNLLIGFFSGLSVLIEDIPGVGKTTLAKSLAAATGLDFGRIQFTPDLLPGDIVGMNIWSQEKRDFIYKEGGIMHQFILADEINRASARTQAALLESMQEGKVTVDGVTRPLPTPFFLVATQNPSQYTGTFTLPEAQLDRFGISFSIGYPDGDEEGKILSMYSNEEANTSILETAVEGVTTPKDVLDIRRKALGLYVDEKVTAFLTRISKETRKNANIKLGMSPRATLHLLKTAKSRAFLRGREYVLPEDILATAVLVLKHRIILSPEARMENKTVEEVLGSLLKAIPLPTGL